MTKVTDIIQLSFFSKYFSTSLFLSIFLVKNIGTIFQYSTKSKETKRVLFSCKYPTMKLKETFYLSCFVFVILSSFQLCRSSRVDYEVAGEVKRPHKFILMPYPIFEDGIKGGPLFFLGTDRLHRPPQNIQHRLKRDVERRNGINPIKILNL